MLDSAIKTALITGASSGLGAEFAHQLAVQGYRLILTARREHRLAELAGVIQTKYGTDVELLPADLSTTDGIEKVVLKITSLPSLDLLINNAGFGTTGRFSTVDPEKHETMVQVHVTAAVLLTRAALPGMISHKNGAIINVSSMAGIIPIRSVLYGTTKAFLISFSEALEDDLRSTGVHVQALCAGFTLTEFHETPEYTNFSHTSIPKFLWLTSEYVVRESLRSLHSHKVICIPGNIYRLAGALSRNSITAGLITSVTRLILNSRYLRLS
jgi:short-subunit dehydrogenase